MKRHCNVCTITRTIYSKPISNNGTVKVKILFEHSTALWSFCSRVRLLYNGRTEYLRSRPKLNYFFVPSTSRKTQSVSSAKCAPPPPYTARPSLPGRSASVVKSVSLTRARSSQTMHNTVEMVAVVTRSGLTQSLTH